MYKTNAELTFPNDLTDDMKAVYLYWLERHEGQGNLPKLSDIHLMDWHKLASRMSIIDAIPDEQMGLRFYWRYAGTALRDFFGIEMSGKMMDEAFDSSAYKAISPTYFEVYKTEKPHLWSRSAGIMNIRDSSRTYERVLYPLRNSKGDAGVRHFWGVYKLD